jgi:hypothetical protein
MMFNKYDSHFYHNSLIINKHSSIITICLPFTQFELITRKKTADFGTSNTFRVLDSRGNSGVPTAGLRETQRDSKGLQILLESGTQEGNSGL